MKYQKIEIPKRMKSNNFRTQSMSVSDNVRIYVMSESDNVRAQKKWNLKRNEISMKMKSEKKRNPNKNEIAKTMKSKKVSELKNSRTQNMSGSHNVSARQCQGQIISGSS